METKLHTSLTTLKILMFQILPIIVKKQIAHPRQNQLCAYHLPMKEKHNTTTKGVHVCQMISLDFELIHWS